MSTEPDLNADYVLDPNTARDRLAEAILTAQHTCDWYIGDATEADWVRAYEAADLVQEGRTDAV